ncbi:terpenoid synthase [Mycena pura]|uniref:Terpenoid synthase n=1 Tax=Mycena pura TaxID=153505 RepID=A0AAD6VJK6_9AGAR|nr:terpenoid synthase [Mycena pura]
MSAPSSTFATCVERLLADLEYRYQPLPPPNADFWDPFHQGMFSRNASPLEHASGGIIERGYPYLLYAKVTALDILVDDIIDDEATCAELAQFSHKLFLGEPQKNSMLAYHATLKDHGSGAPKATYLEGLAPNFPRYLRGRSGASESYVAGIFKAAKEQNLPVDRIIKVFPDAVFFCDVVNDIISFHKELAGETHNFIHIRTRSLASAGKRGSGPAGEWTAHDTPRLLCQGLLEATRRVDGVLRLEECERKMRGEVSDGVDDLDVEIAKQWRRWRDGYISWHFECRRYKLNSSGVTCGVPAL